MVTIVNCPNVTCRHSFPIGLDLDTVTFVGNGMNVAVECPRCHRRFDATGGGDGTFSTVGGRLRRVAKFISEADDGTLNSLRQDLERASENHDVERARQSLAEAGIAASGSKWQDPNFVLAFISLLIAVIGLVLQQRAAGDSPTKEQIDKLISLEEAQLSESGEHASSGPSVSRDITSQPGRNDLCPCGSTRKYKRCHGAHPTSPDHPGNRASDLAGRTSTL
ncbi:YecA family protein [Nocardioides sp. T2.26MG-1]|uniref:YecA family protein n=1 Tax=Nocardioides sp. T2.26MG-1 TaxID=3041166 RepID=UPI0025419512|nr:SEC-C domain-containing protein [Nocardioides sp. T2.26MG-1]